MNAEFQRIAGSDEKAFLSDQWKEIEENNRMGKTKDLFKKIRDTNGTFHGKMGTKKDRNYLFTWGNFLADKLVTDIIFNLYWTYVQWQYPA